MISTVMFKSLFGTTLVVATVGFVIYAFINWQESSKFFGFSPYKTVKLIDLLSFANLYKEKLVCTRGFYLQAEKLSIIKVSLEDDEYTRSAWVNNPKGREIITRVPGQTRAVEATLCGYFESRRAGEFGILPVWNHQLTVDNFETHGDFIELGQYY